LLLVRTGTKGKDRTLIDPNTMSSDGTVALDWDPSEDGKYVTYGTSPNGSKNSTLKIMLRYQNFQIAKLRLPEYGSAENAEQFNFIYAYSPYQHAKAGVEYPSVLLKTADTASRVDPMHAKKMAAPVAGRRR
jgi:hypothetical protein